MKHAKTTYINFRDIETKFDYIWIHVEKFSVPNKYNSPSEIMPTLFRWFRYRNY